MSEVFKLILEAFRTREPLILSDQQHCQYDKYIDLLIDEKKIIKHGEYDFTGKGFALTINGELEDIKVIPLKRDDCRIDTKVKGQGVYFLVVNGIDPDVVAILTFGLDAITFWPAN